MMSGTSGRRSMRPGSLSAEDIFGNRGDTENDVKPILYLRGDKSVYTMAGKIPYSDFEKDMNQYGDLNQASFFDHKFG